CHQHHARRATSAGEREQGCGSARPRGGVTMRPTPPIPDFLRRSPHRAYSSIYELCPEETRIFGTESLYCDWDAETFLLAKDFAPACLIDQRLADGCPRPFHHTDWSTSGEPCTGDATNRNLFRFVEGKASRAKTPPPIPGRK